jgi:dihydroflavonol-4-reductase
VLLERHMLEPRSLAGLDVERIAGDVRELSDVQRALAGAELVFHLAAHISISAESDRMVDAVNVGGTENVVRACMDQGVRRLVHMSSVHALSAVPADQPIDEQRALVEGESALAYDRSKAAAERVVLSAVASGLDAVIVSPAAVFGRHDYGPSLQAESLLRMLRGPLPLTVVGAYNWVDVRDVVEGTLAAAERGRSGERYLLSGHTCTLRALAGHFARESGGFAKVITLPRWSLEIALPLVTLHARLTNKRPVYTRHALQIMASNCDFRCDKARRELGFSPRPLRETVADSVAFYRSAGYL